MLWDIDWRIIQRMLIDTPNYDTEEKEEKEEKEIKFEEQSAEDLEKMFNTYK